MEAEALAQVVRGLVPDWSDVPISNVEFLEGGYSNQNFAFTANAERFVIRIPGERQPFVDRDHEHDYLTRLPQRTSAEVIVHDRTEGYLITRWVEGSLLIDTTISEEELVRYLQALHAHLPAPRRTYSVVEVIAAYGGRSLENPEGVADTVPCHNDLNPWNVIVTEEGWVTLDWEFVGSNDPLFDLVALHQGLELHDGVLLEMAQGYLGTPGYAEDALNERIRRQVELYWRRELAWAQYQIERGQTRREIFEQRATASAKLVRLDALHSI